MSAVPSAGAGLSDALAIHEGDALASRAGSRLLPVGWPLVALFVGYPLWWALGIAPFVAIAAAIPLAVELRAKGALRAPRGFGVWLLLLAWILVGALLLQVTAPESIATTGGNRYGVFVFRYLWFVAATVVLLYVGNMRKELSALWLCRVIGSMFIVIVAGGLLGWAAPKFEFRSLLEIVLGSHGKSAFIQNLIHPTAAQIQDFLGYEQGRPSAPFPFTNSWGVNCAVTLPFFVIGWFHKASQSRRVVGSLVLLASLVPIVASLNRGLWLALVVCGVLLTIRTALHGRPLVLAGGVVAVAIAATIILVSPLGSLIVDRLEHGNSNVGRTNLGLQTLSSTAQGSPVVGFGTTRDPAGNWVSIAGGSTAECPRCSPPPMGTQGQFWFILFTTGFGGALLYIGFFVMQLLRHFWIRSIYVTAGLSSVAMHLITSPFYNTIDTSLLVILAAVGLMWRASLEQGPVTRSRLAVDVRLRGYAGLVRRHWTWLVVALVAGTLSGVGVQAIQGTPVEASQSVFVRDIRNGDTDAGGELSTIDFSLDTEAQLMRSDEVVAAIQKAAGAPLTTSEVLSRLQVSALPNTRILLVHVTLPTADRAAAAAKAAATAYLQVRSDLTNSARSEQLDLLAKRAAALTAVVKAVSAAVPANRDATTNVIKDALSRYTAEVRYVENTRLRLDNNPLDVGQLVGNATTAPATDGWLVKGASGLAIGLAVWALLASLFDGAFRRVVTGRWRRRVHVETLPVISQVPSAGGSADVLDPHDPALAHARTALHAFGPLSGVLATWDNPHAMQVASALDTMGHDTMSHDTPGHATLGHEARDARSGRVVLVTTSTDRTGDVETFERRSRAAGLDPVGLIVVER